MNNDKEKKNITNLWIFDQNKLLILHALYQCNKDEVYCGCDLTKKLDIPKNLLSYHIKILRENNFVSEVKCGQKKEYRINEDKLQKVQKVLSAVELIP